MEYNGSELPEPLLGKQQEEGHTANISNGKKKIAGSAKNLILQSGASSDNHLQQAENAVVVQCTSEDSSMICRTGCDFAEPDKRDADLEFRAAATRKLIYAGGFCLFFMAVEIAGGIFANSLAILTDAAHLLSDVTGFAVSLFAIWASSWQATARQTYGFHRVEILGALVSIQIIWLITGILVYEAINRILHSDQAVNGLLMFSIATLGLLVNVVMIFILGHGHGHGHGGHGHAHHDEETHNHCHNEDDHRDHGHGHLDEETHNHSHNEDDHRDEFLQKHISLQSGPGQEQTNITSYGHEEDTSSHVECKGRQEVVTPSSENINIKGAYLHVFGDLVQSIGVMIAGALIWYNPEWKIMDLVCTLFFSLLVLGTTIKMLRDILEVLMESTPREIDKSMLETGLLKIEGVVAVHDLHIWAITLGKSLLACHIETEPSANSNLVLHNVIDYCKNKFNISHVTVQIEHN